MEKRVNIDTWEKISRGDLNNMGFFPQQSLDDIVGKLLIPDKAFTGFVTAATGPAEVTVGKGLLFDTGKVFFNDTEGGTVVSLLSTLPAATRKIVAITVAGTDIASQLTPRTFLQDAATRATVARETSTEQWRWANIAPVSGVEGPDPQAPGVPANVLVVAWVTLTTTGVESVVTALENVAPTLREEDTRLNALDIWRTLIGTRIETLASDLLALGERIRGTAQFEFVRRVAADVARVKDELKLPSAYTAWDADHFLTDDKSETTHVDWLARVEEGVRFPPAAGFDAQLGLLNVYDEGVINSSDTLLPAWDGAVRISNLGSDGEISISQYQFQTVDMVQKTMSRERLRYGTPFTVCTNSWYWDVHNQSWGPGFAGTFDFINWTFIRDTGEAYNIVGSVDELATQTWSTLNSHSFIRLQQVWKDTVEEAYWDRVVVNSSISGAILAQTFLNAQDGWLSQVNLYFSRVAASGDVHLLLTETTNGAPDMSKVIAQSTVTVANLKASPAGQNIPTPFLFVPTFLGKGRYAIVAVTAGNHFVWNLNNTNFVSGTLFQSTDGAFLQGDLTKDLAFQVLFCKFRNNQTRAQLISLQLVGGIAAIDINARCYVPDGCVLGYEIQVAGVWHALDNVDGGPSVLFTGLPPLLPFRAVFVGTDSVQPALGVAANSRVTTWRPRSDFRAISKVRTMPSPVTVITADVRVEAWRGAPYHTFVAKLLTGGAGVDTTTTLPGTTTENPAPDDPSNAIIRHYTWSVAATSAFRFRFEGTTDNVLTTFHMAERIDIDTP